MTYRPHLAHWQFFGLGLAVLGFVLTAATSGVDDWRVWYFDDNNASVIAAGTAWIGVWRVCFYSHVLDKSKFCRAIDLTDSFTPPEIVAAQVLCMTAILVGLVANVVAGYAVKRIYFNVRNNSSSVRVVFLSAGVLYFLTAACLLVPVFWNMSSVLENRTISFPPEFLLPPAPLQQKLGLGIASGIGSSVLLVICGVLFVSYWYVNKPKDEKKQSSKKSSRCLNTIQSPEGKENSGFVSEKEV